MRTSLSEVGPVRLRRPRWPSAQTTWRSVAATSAVPLALGGFQAALAAALVLLALGGPARRAGFPILVRDTQSLGGPLRIELWQTAFRWLPGVADQTLAPGLFLWGLRGTLAALALLQVAALVLCLRRAATGHRDSVGVWLVGPVVTSVVLLAFPPLSADVFYYAISGHATLVGGNPYLAPPLAFPRDPFLLFNDWLDITSPYGPIWTDLSRDVVALTGADPVASVLAFKMVAGLSALGLALVAYALARRLTVDRGRRLGVLLLVAWQPVVLVEAAGMAHNDAPMLLAALGGLLLLSTEAPGATRGGLLLIAGSALIKYVTLPLLGLAALWRLRPRERAAGLPTIARRWLGDAAAIGVLAVLAFAPYWTGRQTIASLVAQPARLYVNPLWLVPAEAVVGHWRGHAAAAAFARGAGGDVPWVNGTRVAGEVAVVLLLLAAVDRLLSKTWRTAGPSGGDPRTADRPALPYQVRAWAVATAAPAYLLVNSHPWYAVWAAGPIALAWAVAPVARRRWLPAVPWWLLLYLGITAFNLTAYHTWTEATGPVFGWRAHDGVLINDGSSFDGGIWKDNWIAEPARLGAGADYAVQAQIRLDRFPDCGSYGIVVRSGYEAGIHVCPGGRASLRAKPGIVLQEVPVVVDTHWHTYRVEVRATSIRFLTDGRVTLAATDARYRAAGQVGLWSDRTAVSVRDFRVIALPAGP